MAKQSTLFSSFASDENTPPRPRGKSKPKPTMFSDDDDSLVISDDHSESDFALSDDEPKKKPAKAAAKPKAAPKSKAKPLQEVANDNAPVPSPKGTPKGKKGSASEQYQKLTQLEHILKRPDTYIGSVEATASPMWVWNQTTSALEHKMVTIVPGLYKIFDEILVNAADNKIRDPKMDSLEVTIDADKNEISVMNNGKGIPVEIHDKEKIYIPELIFGNLLTSSNYNDNEKKVVGGRNGFGAKLCNIFSTEFKLETADQKNGKIYTQTWSNNMSKVDKPKIKELKTKKEYTKVTFKPDLKLFNMTELDADTVGVLMRRVYDIAGTTHGVKVKLNGTRLALKDFKAYVDLYLKSLVADEDNEVVQKSKIVHEIVNDRWEVAFAVSDGTYQNVSFVNSIATTSGGTHVNYIADQLVAKLTATAKKKLKDAQVKPAQLKANMFIFINCLIENPAFTSQTKEQMTTKVSAFGSKCELSDKFIKQVTNNTDIMERVLNIAGRNADAALKKTDGSSKKKRITTLVKLEDAQLAGTKRGHECTLILTEGDSAMTMANAGLSVIGRERYGAFPLRGKMLNVREASTDQIMKNAEIQAIKEIIGLQHKKHYTSCKDLRYGHLMIMTDQDHDGSHIKGLIINFLETMFPGLLQIPGFLLEFITPIVKVMVMRGKKVVKTIPFYNMPEYEAWRDFEGQQCTWTSKYFKGLGTTPTADATEYFKDLDRHMKQFHAVTAEDRPFIELAFSKKKADDRKEWLRKYKPGTHLDPKLTHIPVSDFINKELILFSMADNMRSIASVCDGFKPGQRKVLFGSFKRKFTVSIRVAQLVGYISEHTGYHHGEASLGSTIMAMAQDFAGSNNIYLMKPDGGFGSRSQGGKDAAAMRYAQTELMDITKAIFNKQDEPLYNYVTDDDTPVEPEYYLPVLPMLLVNGCEGIGSGWSTSIPPYNPLDIVDNLRRMLKDEPPVPMIPWFRGWHGEVEPVGDGRYKVKGLIEQVDERTLCITELPARMWTISMKEFLLSSLIDSKNEKGWIEDFTEDHGFRVKFNITLSEKEMEKTRQIGLRERFKLISSLSTSNMVAFDPEGRIKKYDSPEAIMKEYFPVRLEFYQKRKDRLVSDFEQQLEKLTAQARFIKLIIDKKLNINNKGRKVLIAELSELKFPRYGKNGERLASDAKAAIAEDEEAPSDEVAEDLAEAEEIHGKIPTNGYDYLLGMALWSLTKERYEKLLRERDGKEEELIELLKKSAKDIWMDDLDVFMEAYEKFEEQDVEKQQKLDNYTGKKGATKRKRAAKKKAGDDDDEDFVVGKKAKTAAKPKTAAAKSRAKSSSASVEPEVVDLDDVKVKKEPGISKTKPRLSDTATSPKFKNTFGSLGSTSIFGDSPVKSSPTKINRLGAAGGRLQFGSGKLDSEFEIPKKKRVSLFGSLSDDDDDLDMGGSIEEVQDVAKPVKKAAPKKAAPRAAPKAAPKKTAPKKKSIFDDSDEDMNLSDDEVAEVASSASSRASSRASSARPRRAAAPKKSVYVDSDDSDLDIVDDEEDVSMFNDDDE
ncbi:YALIA101S06e03708g1_1 [Yarrowia lipolytica]|nr:DNA topoisomerase 2 [Yarrowia lipolytica]SEI35172.1 YALIA101S06e03708g1_1 [Yarrowia lipolytica]